LRAELLSEATTFVYLTQKGKINMVKSTFVQVSPMTFIDAAAVTALGVDARYESQEPGFYIDIYTLGGSCHNTMLCGVPFGESKHYYPQTAHKQEWLDKVEKIAVSEVKKLLSRIEEAKSPK